MTTKLPTKDDQGRKFLFFHLGTPIFEGDENHQTLERIRTEFGGDIKKAIKHDVKSINKLFK